MINSSVHRATGTVETGSEQVRGPTALPSLLISKSALICEYTGSFVGHSPMFAIPGAGVCRNFPTTDSPLLGLSVCGATRNTFSVAEGGKLYRLAASCGAGIETARSIPNKHRKKGPDLRILELRWKSVLKLMMTSQCPPEGSRDDIRHSRRSQPCDQSRSILG